MLDMAAVQNRIAFEADLQAARAVRLNLSSDTAALPGDEQRCCDAGMDSFLSKPYTLAALHATVSARLATAGEQTPAMPAAMPDADAPSIGLAGIEALRDIGENGGMHLARQVL